MKSQSTDLLVKSALNKLMYRLTCPKLDKVQKFWYLEECSLIAYCGVIIFHNQYIKTEKFIATVAIKKTRHLVNLPYKAGISN